MKSKIKIIAIIGVLALFVSCANKEEGMIAEMAEKGCYRFV